MWSTLKRCGAHHQLDASINRDRATYQLPFSPTSIPHTHCASVSTTTCFLTGTIPSLLLLLFFSSLLIFLSTNPPPLYRHPGRAPLYTSTSTSVQNPKTHRSRRFVDGFSSPPSNDFILRRDDSCPPKDLRCIPTEIAIYAPRPGYAQTGIYAPTPVYTPPYRYIRQACTS